MTPHPPLPLSSLTVSYNHNFDGTTKVSWNNMKYATELNLFYFARYTGCLKKLEQKPLIPKVKGSNTKTISTRKEAQKHFNSV